MSLNLIPGLVDCKNCDLYQNGFVVPGRGPVPAQTMFVGEAPGREENNTGVPFIGAAGKLLTKLIELAGIDPAGAYFTNVVKHWPGEGNPTPKIKYMRACGAWLNTEIEQVDPYIIVMLGKTAISRLAPDLKLKLHHGQKFTREMNGRNRTLIPMYHPAAMLHQRALKPIIEYDFRQLLEDNLIPPPVKSIPEEPPFQTVPIELPGVDQPTVLAIDLETTGLDPETDNIVCVSWAWEKNEGHVTYYVAEFMDWIKGWRGPVVFHNAQFDMAFMAKYGVYFPPEKIWDTMLSGYVLGKERLSLKGRAMLELGYEMETFEALAGEKPKDASLIPPEELVPYAAADAVVTRIFYQRDRTEIAMNHAGPILDIQHQLIPVLDNMRRRGILVDREKLQALKVEATREKIDATVKVWETVGHDFNMDSLPQLRHVLFDELGLRPLKRTKSRAAWSTDSESLKILSSQHPIVPALLDYREIGKMRGTYIEPVEKHLGKDGRVHPTWLQIGTRSSRLSCENPNAQNQPSRSEVWKKKIRGLYVAAPNNILLSADYSQVELRVAAALSSDVRMREIYESGGNIHLYTLHNILRLPGADSQSHPAEYKLSKNINFGMIYRLSDKGLQRYLWTMAGIRVSLEESHKIRTQFLNEFPGLMAWEDTVVKQVMNYGWTETLLHHRRYFPELDPQDPEETLKAAINHPVQGTAGGDIMRTAMVRLGHLPLILNIHDELVFELPESEVGEIKNEVCGIMIETAESLLGFPVEVDVAVGKNWGELD